MAHRLLPRNGQHLEPAEIVRRMRAEFDFVDADADAGNEHIADMLLQFQRMKAPQAIVDAHRAMLGHAVQVIASDREDFDDDFLRFTALPGEGPFISYCSRQHEKAAALLIERACRILGYEAELV